MPVLTVPCSLFRREFETKCWLWRSAAASEVKRLIVYAGICDWGSKEFIE